LKGTTHEHGHGKSKRWKIKRKSAWAMEILQGMATVAPSGIGYDDTV
jgi:hypothetical protein